LSEITFHPQELIRQPSRVQTTLLLASRSSSRKTVLGE
jgi:hypothetical protein